jgi:hypothetical protein
VASCAARCLDAKLAAAKKPTIGQVKAVLHRDRNAMQRPQPFSMQDRQPSAALARLLRPDNNERIQLRVQLLDLP